MIEITNQVVLSSSSKFYVIIYYGYLRRTIVESYDDTDIFPHYFSFDTKLTTRHTVWTMIIGGYFTWISVFGINQTQVQRYLTVPDKKKVVK